MARKAFLGLLRVAAVLLLALFAPADNFTYPNGWWYFGLTLGWMFLMTLYLMMFDPPLLRNRLNLSERELGQKIFQLCAGTSFLGMLIVSSLDYRWGWSKVGIAWQIVGFALVFCGYVLVFFVFWANSYAAAIITVTKEQKVISSGPYSLVRHPMYLGMLLVVVGTPLALVSYWGLAFVSGVIIPLVWRLLAEENFLRAKLEGYEAYCANTKYRLIPLIW